MKNPIKKKTLLIALAAIVLLIAGCTQPEDIIQPSARLYIPESARSTRTIMPGTLPSPDHYTITLTSTTKEVDPLVFKNEKASGDGYINLIGIEYDTYDVKAEGFNKDNLKIYEGNGQEQLVVNNKLMTVVVKLHPIATPGTKGNIAVKFDWSSINIPTEINSRSIGTSISANGPISQAVLDGKLHFVLYIGDTVETMVEHKQPKADMDKITWDKTKDAPGSKICVFTDIPVTDTGVYTAFSIKNDKGEVLVDKQFTSAAHIYTGQTSYYNGKEGFEIKLKENRDKWYRNISNVRASYPFTNADSTLNINWNDVRPNGKSIFETITFTYGRMDGVGTPVTVVINPAEQQNTEFLMENLVPGVEYYVTSQTKSLTGMLSDVKKWTVTKDHGFTTKVEVNSLEFTAGDEQRTITTGDTFKMTAKIDGISSTGEAMAPSYSDIYWTASEAGTLAIENLDIAATEKIITAEQPGVSTITITNRDPNPNAPNTKTTSVNEVHVHLNAPTGINLELLATDEAQTGIKITWDEVLFAESYAIQRKEAGESTDNYKVIANVLAPDHSFVDLTGLSGKSYTYRVVAKNKTADDKFALKNFSADSVPSAESEPMTIPTPQLKLELVNPTDQNFTLIDNGQNLTVIDGFPTITLEAGDIKTIAVAPIEGATYEWILNNHTYPISPEQDSKEFTLSTELQYLDYGSIKGLQTLVLSANINGRTYTTTIIFSLVTLPVERIELTEETIAIPERLSTTDTTEITIEAIVTGGTSDNPLEPTNNAVQYLLANPEMAQIAEIDMDKGVVTVHKAGTVEFVAYSEEKTDIRASKTITFYTPTVDSHADLVSKVNTVLYDHLHKADNKFKGDWFPPTSGDAHQYCNVYDGTDGNTGKIHIKSARGGGSYTKQEHEPGYIEFTNYVIDSEGTTVSGKLMVTASENQGAFTSGYQNTDPLMKIGSTYTGTVCDNTLTIKLPNTQGQATIQYVDIDVTQTNVGTYFVDFENAIDWHDPLKPAFSGKKTLSEAQLSDITKPY